MWLWSELGIPHTTDGKLIRRAYATRLRAIDPDKDPAAFQRLRAAYEQASAISARAALPVPQDQDGEDEVFDDDGYDYDPEGDTGSLNIVFPAQKPAFQPERPARDPLPAEPSTREPTPDELERLAARTDINQLLKGGDARGALARLTRALAQGLVQIGERDYALEAIMPAVVADKAISAADFLALLHQVGWDLRARYGDWLTPTRRAAMARSEAEAWYLDLVKSAEPLESRFSSAAIRRPDLYKARRNKGRAARLLLNGRQFIRFTKRGAAAIETLLRFYEHYKPWIGHRFAPANIARAEAIIERQETVQSLRNGAFVVVGSIIVIAFVLGAAVSFNAFPLIGAFFIGSRIYRAIKKSEG